VKSLRSAIVGFENSGSGRKKLLREFHVSRKEAQRHREMRDAINKCVPPPSKILEEWLNETYGSLTIIDNDLTSVPMLNPELSAFSRFFEIQSSIKKKREAENAHSDYISKVSEMRRISSKLDQNKEEVDKVVSELKDKAEIGGDRVSRKEISRVSKRISSIDEKIDTLKVDVKKERKELKRLEKFSRISSGRGGISSIEDIRGIAAKGGSLSTEELGALLESGGFSSISETKKDIQGKAPVGDNSRKKMRRIGVSRKGSRQGRVASRRE
jgi:tetrahydromethanopterin S-methyltransferase subunit G